MSILASLVNAYGRPSKQGEMPPLGFATQNIHCCIVLSSKGEMTGPPVLWHKNDKGRPAARPVNVPYFGGRSGSSAPPYFLWDNTAYVLGITAKENFDAERRFRDFRDYHLRVLAGTTDEGLNAVVQFLQDWNRDNYSSRGFPTDLQDRNIVFRLSSEKKFIHESPEAVAIWNTINTPDTIGERICLISGTRSDIARLHPPIISFENPARIVSFDKDNDAFSSYGHVQAENAPVGIDAAFAYTAVLNKFLARDSRHRIQIGDASTVFWADASEAKFASNAERVFAEMFGASDFDTSVEDVAAAKQIGIKLAQIREGKPLEDVEPELAEGVRFTVLGLAPNAARLSIRFHFENDFGVLTRNYQRFVEDMRVAPSPREPYPPLWKYLSELAVLGKRENVPPNLAGEWMRSILTGANYPLTLLSSVLMRIRSDGDVNAMRVGILKAVLIRNFKKEAPVALDPDNRNKGYVLGRLFAVYEEIQRAALGSKVNSTIKDKFYGSASAQPQKVFKILEGGSANHLSKVRKLSPGREYNLKALQNDIMNLMAPGEEPYPPSLSVLDQALFGLGYHHQHSIFWTRKNENVKTAGEATE